MLIALLAVLGVDLIVIVVVAAGVLSRKRWVSRQPGAGGDQRHQLLGTERPDNTHREERLRVAPDNP